MHKSEACASCGKQLCMLGQGCLPQLQQHSTHVDGPAWLRSCRVDSGWPSSNADLTAAKQQGWRHLTGGSIGGSRSLQRQAVNPGARSLAVDAQLRLWPALTGEQVADQLGLLPGGQRLHRDLAAVLCVVLWVVKRHNDLCRAGGGGGGGSNRRRWRVSLASLIHSRLRTAMTAPAAGRPRARSDHPRPRRPPASRAAGPGPHLVPSVLQLDDPAHLRHAGRLRWLCRQPPRSLSACCSRTSDRCRKRGEVQNACQHRPLLYLRPCRLPCPLADAAHTANHRSAPLEPLRKSTTCLHWLH